jgi:hypothetical protein
MARYALIDGYLDTMRSRIGWRGDLDDVVAEMEDHLYSTTEGLCARGLDRLEAQRATLDRFGDPKVLQLAFASNQRGGIAMPTTFTVQAGRLASIAAACWLVATVLVALNTWFGENDWSTPMYFLIMGAVTLGGVIGLIALIGLGRRLGGLGPVGLIGIIILGIGVFAGFFVTWAVPFWMPLQGVGLFLIALSARRSTEVPQIGLLAVGSAFIVGTIAFTVARMLEVGWSDRYGDYPLAWFIGFAVGAMGLAAGLAILGSWLAGEEPADADVTPITA